MSKKYILYSKHLKKISKFEREKKIEKKKIEIKKKKSVISDTKFYHQQI